MASNEIYVAAEFACNFEDLVTIGYKNMLPDPSQNTHLVRLIALR